MSWVIRMGRRRGHGEYWVGDSTHGDDMWMLAQKRAYVFDSHLIACATLDAIVAEARIVRLVPAPQPKELRPPTEPMDGLFGLTYASYAILRRTVMQSMPLEWQDKFVALIEEMQEAMRKAGIDHWPDDFVVRLKNNRGRFITDPCPHYRRAPNVLEPA